MPSRGSLRCCLLLLWLPCAHAQSVSEKWNFFASETAASLTLVAAGAHAACTQATRFAPLYGAAFWRKAAFFRRFGAAATFNWANVAGSAMSAAMSNAYYPPVSRTAAVSAVNWGTNVAGAGFSNPLPEFGPDIAHWWKKLRPFRH
jgi:hypothetical protein